jgi:hypothetical protein
MRRLFFFHAFLTLVAADAFAQSQPAGGPTAPPVPPPPATLEPPPPPAAGEPANPKMEPPPPPAVDDDATPARVHRVLLGARLGGVFPQPFNKLDSSFVIGLEGGYVLPALHDRLAVTLTTEYTQPPADGGGMQAGVGDAGTYSWSITQREWTFGLAAVFRLDFFGKRVVPFAAIGPRLYLLQTKANGSAGGMPFGEHTEQSTTVGGLGALGTDIRLGPGWLLVELQLAASALSHTTTGDTNSGALELRVGYRFYL